MSESGKFVLRLDPQLHSQLKREAERKGVSLNQFIVNKLIDDNSSQFEIIKKVFKEHLVGIVVFGSYVRNEQRKSSDIDLLIVLDGEAVIERKLYQIWDDKVQPILGQEYSPQFVKIPGDSKNVSSIWLEVALEGDIVYEKDLSLRTFIFEVKQLISSGIFKRKITYGQPYWVREPHAK